MIAVHNLVALWFACVFSGGAIALLYSLAIMWRNQKRLQSSRKPFQGADLATFPEPVQQMIQDSLALRARKPAPLSPLLIVAALSLALAHNLCGHAFHPALHAALPTAMIGWPSLLLTMGLGSCLIPVVAIAFVEVACRKIRKDIRERNQPTYSAVEPAV